MFRLERRLATQAALIVSPLPNAAEYFTRFHGVPESRVLWLSNGVNCALDPDLRISQPPAAGTGNSFRLQYFGSLGRTNYVEVLLRSMALAIRQTSKNLQLNVYGDGPLRKPLSALVTELGLDDHVSFMEPIPQEAVRSESQRGDALAFVVGDHPDLYRYGISMNKMFDYLAAGRWILMGANVPFNPLADAPGCTITDATPEALAEGLVTLAEMPLALRESGARANMDLARDRYDYRYLAQVLAERLDRIITPMDTQ
jgi:glycosyltransferase involved in cell wall biosynthesis